MAVTFLDHVDSALGRLTEAAAGLTEVRVRAPSALPDWTRGHVLAHLVGFGRGARRQIAYALRDDLVEFYDGGRAGRNADIEANAGRSAADLVAELHATMDGLRDDWARLGERDWERRVAYRDGRLVDVLLCCWREAEIHLVDLDIGVRPSAWSAPFCRHAIEFLAPRVPTGVRLELVADDGDPIVLGTGRTVTVGAVLTDLTAWLAGRRPERTPDCSDPELPELGPWP